MNFGRLKALCTIGTISGRLQWQKQITSSWSGKLPLQLLFYDLKLIFSNQTIQFPVWHTKQLLSLTFLKLKICKFPGNKENQVVS